MTIFDKIDSIGGVAPLGTPKFQPLSEEETSALERHLGSRLPTGYREYLARFGASMPNEVVVFRASASRPNDLPHELGYFYGGAAGRDDLARIISIYKGRIPNTVIPIADDGGGNQICLGIDGNERGKVYYWVHDYIGDHDDPCDVEGYLKRHGEAMPPEVRLANLQLVADSFEEFIDRLQVVEE